MAIPFSRLMLLAALALTVGALPAAAESGQATGKRQHKPFRLRAEYDSALSLEDEEFALTDFMGPEGLWLVQLPVDPNNWDFDLLEDIHNAVTAEDGPRVGVVAIYPAGRRTQDADDALSYVYDHYMMVGLTDSETQAGLPRVGRDVTVQELDPVERAIIGSFKQMKDSVIQNIR